jgi:hypothetical protein
MKYYQLRAVYVLCSDYHSGQGSRGYRLLCVLDRKLKRMAKTLGYAKYAHTEQAEKVRKHPFYKLMEERYKDKL